MWIQDNAIKILRLCRSTSLYSNIHVTSFHSFTHNNDFMTGEGKEREEGGRRGRQKREREKEKGGRME